jgi:hypothetical protein
VSPTELSRVTAPSIEIDGQLVSQQLSDDLLELRISRGTRTTGRATLTFVDRTFRVASSELKLGAAVKISAIEPRSVLFDGEITAVTVARTLSRAPAPSRPSPRSRPRTSSSRSRGRTACR